MKRLIVVLSLVAVLCTGCQSLTKLPPITAQSVDYIRTDPAGGTKIHAEGVYFDAKTNTVRAEAASWDTVYPMWSFHVSAKGYVQEATPKAEALPAQPVTK